VLLLLDVEPLLELPELLCDPLDPVPLEPALLEEPVPELVPPELPVAPEDPPPPSSPLDPELEPCWLLRFPPPPLLLEQATDSATRPRENVARERTGNLLTISIHCLARTPIHVSSTMPSPGSVWMVMPSAETWAAACTASSPTLGGIEK
jgi:hypothetical protein